jgi:C4-type Zn-finger protein
VGTFRDLREVVGRLKHRSETRKYCPVCGSPRLKLAGGADFWLMPGKFVCQDCGYTGFVVMEKDEDDSVKEGAEKRYAVGKEAEFSDGEKEGF